MLLTLLSQRPVFLRWLSVNLWWLDASILHEPCCSLGKEAASRARLLTVPLLLDPEYGAILRWVSSDNASIRIPCITYSSYTLSNLSPLFHSALAYDVDEVVFGWVMCIKSCLFLLLYHPLGTSPANSWEDHNTKILCPSIDAKATSILMWCPRWGVQHRAFCEKVPQPKSSTFIYLIGITRQSRSIQ